jgi:hypothetical protein
MSAEVVPLGGEYRSLWSQLHSIDEQLYTQAKERSQVIVLMGKMNREQEEVENALERALAGDTIDRKEVEKALKHIKNARQYEARLAPHYKAGEMAANSLRSMVSHIGAKLKAVLR